MPHFTSYLIVTNDASYRDDGHVVELDISQTLNLKPTIWQETVTCKLFLAPAILVEHNIIFEDLFQRILYLQD